MSSFCVGSVNDIPRTITDYTKDGKCSRCGGCCTNYLPLSKHEIIRIHNFIRKHDIKEQRLILPTATPTFDVTCPFLKREGETSQCLIYEVRPLICQRFICNQPQDIIDEQKNALISARGLTDLREEFFDDSILYNKLKH